jgi:hypothetical protein
VRRSFWKEALKMQCKEMRSTTNLPGSRASLEVMSRAGRPRRKPVLVYTIDVHSIPGQPFGRETFSVRADAESFVEQMCGDDPEHASDLRIEERELIAA